MSSEILQSFLRGELRGDLVQAVRAQAQETVLQQLTAKQAAKDAAAVIATAEAMIPDVQNKIALYGEAFEAREAGVDNLKRSILDLRHQLQVAEHEKNLSALSSIQVEIVAKERELSTVQGELTTARYSRLDQQAKLDKLTNALAQLQPLAGGTNV